MTGQLGAGVGVAPIIDDPETAGIFAAAAQRRLVVQQCVSCGRHQQPPRPRCTRCHQAEMVWDELPQRGSVHTWTVVEHQIHPSFVPPYTVVLVDVDTAGLPEDTGAIRFLGYLPGTPEIGVGTGLRTVFEEIEPGTWLPNWELDQS